MGALLWGAFLLQCAHLPLCTLALTLLWGWESLTPTPLWIGFYLLLVPGPGAGLEMGLGPGWVNKRSSWSPG